MAEQALIPKIPPIRKTYSEPVEPLTPKTTEAVVPEVVIVPAEPEPVEPVAPKLAQPTILEPVVPKSIEAEVPRTTAAKEPSNAVVPEATEVTAPSENAIQVVETSPSTTVFQLATYTSFALTFCFAMIAAIAVFRKAAKASVIKRFAIGAKVLSLSYFVIIFNGVFSAYLYSIFLNNGDKSYPMIVPVLSWVLVGPAVAIVLNSLLTREDVLDVKKVFFDASTYLVIFGFIAASQVPSLSESDSLILSFLGVFFFIFPIIRFSTALKFSKVYHPEMQEMFVQILVCSLLLLPLLLPVLVFANSAFLNDDSFTLLLFNLITFVFVLMSGLLMIISIDYITQGINTDQLVVKKASPPIAPSDTGPNAPVAPSNASASPVSPNRSLAPSIPEVSEPVPEEPSRPKAPVVPAAPAEFKTATYSEEDSTDSSFSIKEPSETLAFDIEKLDSTLINFDPLKSSSDKPKADGIKSSTSTKGSNSPQKPKNPKAPKSPGNSKSMDPNPRIKPPDKPKKRF